MNNATTNLFQAADQWRERPDDERFFTLAEFAAATRAHRDTAEQRLMKADRLRVIDIGADGRPVDAADTTGEPADRIDGPKVGPRGADHAAAPLAIVGPDDRPAALTHWAFGQLCGRLGAPADYLRRLPTHAVGQLLTHHLADDAHRGKTLNVLSHAAGEGASLDTCRSLTSDDYARIWNTELAEKLQELESYGWRVPPARPVRAGQAGTRLATAADVLAAANHPTLGIREGQEIAPAGLYASDHDCFALLINEERNVADGSEGGLFRGLMVSNSEVGAGALWVASFLFRSVCGNHIIWDASEIEEYRLVHRGRNDQTFRWRFTGDVRRLGDSSGRKDEARIAAARRFELGSTREEVISRLFKERILPKKTLELAYDAACRETDYTRGDSPRSAWGFAQGITRISQELAQHADRRHEIDRAAGRVLHLAL